MTSIHLNDFLKDLRKLADKNKAVVLQRFFKTGVGEYGEGDKFLGITVPRQRNLIKCHSCLDLQDIKMLLKSQWHEERFSALLFLVRQYQISKNLSEQKKLYKFYLNNARSINNWDLVDTSAPHIVGHFLFSNNENTTILQRLANENNLWQRRIAIVATWYFIRQHRFTETLALARKLLCDKEDLIHKATGWMLREVGKRDQMELENFLCRHHTNMPRTMLRYAIEKLPAKKRKFYLG